MFAITGSKGFQITFANGWTASVQFGPGNYCEHHMASWHMAGVDPKHPIRSVNAEFAVIGDSVEEPKGWQTPDEVLQLLAEVAQRPKFVASR